mmetsp:Transcript_110580/g.276959  ORF Transcript_110580/g.276959 Transcript_110580/m.276959 type:complete len:486 (+) Transcript_110580:70-1527(+)
MVGCILMPASLLLAKVLVLGSGMPAVVRALSGLPTHATLALLPETHSGEDIAEPALAAPTSLVAPADSQRECPAALPDVDTLELALLAGDALFGRSLTNGTLINLGWQRGPSHPYIVSYEKGCADGRCDYCAVSFTASGDIGGFFDETDLTPRHFCGAEGVRGGYVHRMRKFFRDDSFANIVRALSSSRCCRVYSTGHSLGASMAAMFAFCANQRKSAPILDKLAFAGITDNVTLVTFAEDRLSKVPLYNGEPGRCFEGARHAITDGSTETLSISSREAQVAGIQVVAQTMKIMSSSTEAETVEQMLAQLEALPEGTPVWQAALDEALFRISPYLEQVGDQLTTQAFHLNSGDEVEAPLEAELWLNYTMKYKAELRFTFDGVPGLHPDLKFPNVPYLPLQHPRSSVPGEVVPAPETCSSSAPSLPNYNVIQVYFGTLAYRLEYGDLLPSHELCCYIRALSPNPEDADCGLKYFNDTRVECPATWP